MAAKLRVFLDADVIFAGSASPPEQGASHVVLVLGELTLIDGVTSQQAITEVERNLAAKLPAKLPEFRAIVLRCLRVVRDPDPGELTSHKGQAHIEDLPILVAALREGCDYLLTFNLRHYSPTGKRIVVQRPGEFIATVREILSKISREQSD